MADRSNTQCAVLRRIRAFGLFLFAIPALAQDSSQFIGAAACAGCHSTATADWTAGRHSKMLQPATAASVVGDFTRTRLSLHNAPYKLRSADGVFYISESNLTGKEQEYRVQYTLGSRRIQHYLTTLPDGRIILLAPSWDVTRKEWFHNMDIVNPEESDGSSVQIWNKNCYSCHVSREQKNFDPARNAYDTKWQDAGTNCERCHGPGAQHAIAKTKETVVVPTRLDPLRSTMVCAQCHSLRDMVSEGYTAGANYYDYFLPLLEYGQKMGSDPAYWADGRPRRFSNDAVGFMQSECFLRGGATCASCHTNLHDPRVEKNEAIRPGANGICASCHSGIAANAKAHSHHENTSCVECHMPRTVFSIKAAIRDHTISVPSPENTTRFAIPNACGACHADKDSLWATAKLDQWFGADDRRRKLPARAAAFSDARAGKQEAIEPLLALLASQSNGPFARANAVGHLSRFVADPRVAHALEQAVKDKEPLVRAVAALRMGPKSAPALIEALGDPVRSVRAGAVLSLVNFGVPKLSAQDAQHFAEAKKEYLARAAIYSDDANEQYTAGGFLLLSGEPAAAITALQASLKLDPAAPSRYLLAVAHMQLNQRDEALRVLNAIPKSDPNFAAARTLLARIRN